jgi:hypothetical protein
MFFDRSGAPVTLPELIRLFSDPEYRFLARDMLATPDSGGIEVVTAWLGIDQRAGIDGSDEQDRGRPIIFGTVARDPTRANGLIEGREWWARTEAEALANHARLLERLRRLLRLWAL